MTSPFDLIKQIVENLRTPENLNSHPWAKSLTVQQAVAADPSLADKDPGAQLILTVAGLFRQLMPATPPQKNGKRLDTRWGRFGILAANYFAPLLYGRMYPHNLREAWQRIDQAILLFAYDVPPDHLTPEQIEQSRLIGNDVNWGANSTISDWHHNGLQDLADLFVSREEQLSRANGESASVLDGSVALAPDKGRRYKGRASSKWKLAWRLGALVVLFAFLACLVLLGLKGLQLYRMLQVVKTDVTTLEKLNPSSLNSGSLAQVGPLLDKTHKDIETVRTNAYPWLGMGKSLGWVPVYGGDLKYSSDLLEFGSDLTLAASQAYASAFPIWQSVHGADGDVKATELTAALLKAQPAISASQVTLEEAILVRQRININELSPSSAALLKRVDPYLSSFNDGLSLAQSLPTLLGGSKEGPKTYLILIQNEDELRPTGGFITAVGKVVVWNGKLMSWDVADSYTVDDVNKAYPTAPWQLQSFMNIPIVTFRDSNWSPDFPTTVMWAEYLYAYTNSYSVNGVIAIDQHVLKALLSVVGPTYVSEIGTTVTADNVEQTMRAQKVPPTAELQDPNWYRKHFLNPIAGAVLNKVLSGQGVSWDQLLIAMKDELDQRHILVELDDPALSKVLSERGWDGAVARTSGDYLMVVDTNVGYNKTNAVVTSRLSYDVDLTDLKAPTSNLSVVEHNSAQGPADQCVQMPPIIDRSALESWYAIDRCFYDYLRVYLPAGTLIKKSTPHSVSRDDMVMLDEDVPPRVDPLDDALPGLQGFGTLYDINMGQSLETDFQFSLPVAIITTDPISHDQVYQLKIQKQPGTDATPITVRVHLPTGAQITALSPTVFTRVGNNLLFELTLKTDINIRIQFHP